MTESRSPQGWGLRQRIAVALVAGGVGLLAIVGVSGTLLTQVQDAQTRVVDNYYTALGMSNRRFISWLDIETAIRGYALTGERNSLAPLQQAQAAQAANPVARIRVLLAPDPASQADLDAFEAAAARWYSEWAVPSIASITSTGHLTAAQTERGQVLFDQIRQDYDTFTSQVRTSRSQALSSLRLRTNLLFVAVVLSALGAVAVAGLLWWLLRRWVSRPVEELAREARLVSAGELDHAVRVDGPPEFVSLAQDMDGMRRRLVDQIAAAEGARREIADARARLEEQAAALQQSNRDLEQFAYVASHDLQEPLRKIASFCQMLQRRYAGRLDDRADQYIGYAVDGALRMQQLINALLEFSRVGRAPIPQTEVDLQECIRQAMSNLEVARQESGVEITWDPLPSVRGEPSLLTQLLQNLLANAIKFRTRESPRAHIGVRRDGDYWQFWCEDNGIGIEARYAERVFLIFQQLHTSDRYSGTGIGLALCRRIVEYHGGVIWVDERDGPGTTIRWTLPVAGGTAYSDGADSSGQERSRGGIRSRGREGVASAARVATVKGSGADDA